MRIVLAPVLAAMAVTVPGAAHAAVSLVTDPAALVNPMIGTADTPTSRPRSPGSG